MFSKNCFSPSARYYFVFIPFLLIPHPPDWIELNPKVCEYASTTPSCGGDPGTLLLVVASRIVFQIPFVAYCFVANQKTEICRRPANGVFIWWIAKMKASRAWGQYTVHSVCGVCVAQPNHMSKWWVDLIQTAENFWIPKGWIPKIWFKLLKKIASGWKWLSQKHTWVRVWSWPLNAEEFTGAKPPTNPPPDPHHLLFFYLDLLYTKNTLFQRFWTM